MSETDGKGQVRIDRWLWAARFFKTRSQAATAIDSGRIHVNGMPIKRAKLVAIGDAVIVSKGPYEFHLEVRGLAERRGSALEAQKLYQETEESSEARARLAEERALERSLAPTPIIKGRPTKKDRRALDKLTGRRSDDL